jgi:hypothetical protein
MIPARVAQLAIGAIVTAASTVGIPVGAPIPPGAISVVRFDGGGSAFAAVPPHSPALIRSDGTSAPEASGVLLFENDRPLGPAHALHADIAAVGGGRDSHWNGSLYFSTPDGSDPRPNGRAYRYEDRARLPPGFLATGISCIALSLVSLSWRFFAALARAAAQVGGPPRAWCFSSAATGCWLSWR